MSLDPDPELEALSYEELVSRLEATIEQMSAGDIGIEEVTDLYEQAGRLHAAAAARLERIQERIEHLTAEPDA